MSLHTIGECRKVLAIIMLCRGAGGDSDSGVSARVLSTFLNELDGISTINKKGSEVLVIAACTELSSLDNALLRPGRLHHHIHIHSPSIQDLTAILEYRLKSVPHDIIDTSAIIARMTRRLQRVSNADVMALCRAAVVVALKESIASHEGGNLEAIRTVSLSSRHFELAQQDEINITTSDCYTSRF